MKSKNLYTQNFTVMETTNFKIVLVGDGNVGKTSFLHRHLTGEFRNEYVSTIGVEVHVLTFESNYGAIRFNVWDCAGEEKFRGLGESYFIGSDGAIFMFDLTNEDSYKNIADWDRKINKVMNKYHSGKAIPKVFCGNKTDVKERKVSMRQITYPRKIDAKYYDISVKSCFNFEKPFLELARKLTKHEDLVFNRVIYSPPTFE